MEPTLLVKTNTLRLKYLLQLKRFRLGVFRLDEGWVAYYVEVPDDSQHPARLWSVVQREDEIQALRILTEKSRCVVHLFNEIALNQAHSTTEVKIKTSAKDILDESRLFPDDAELPVEIIDGKLAADSFDWPIVDVDIASWHPVSNTYITNAAGHSLISLFAKDEGDQQEQIGVWLVDTLHPKGVVRNPIVEEPSGNRELTDLLLSYEKGAFLFESKALGVLSRKRLPDRAKLSSDLKSSVERAMRQLAGGISNMKREFRVTTAEGVEVDVDHENLSHAIILVPDLALLSLYPGYSDSVANFMEKTGGFIHVLDPAELLRVVQAATKISSMGKKTTPLMAFDYLLIERAKKAVQYESPDFAVLLRIIDEPEDKETNSAEARTLGLDND